MPFREHAHHTPPGYATPQIRREVEHLKGLVRISASYGLKLRLAEMNSVSNSGKDGVSNVMASALWTLDLSLEAAEAGEAGAAVVRAAYMVASVERFLTQCVVVDIVSPAGTIGVNLHQGAGSTFYSAITHAPGIIPRVKPAFYGPLMFVQALGSGSRMLQRTVNGPSSSKIFPLEEIKTSRVRIVVINKEKWRAGNVDVAIHGPKRYATCKITRLVAAGSNPLEARTGISLGGQAFQERGARLLGKEVRETLTLQLMNGRSQGRIYMPPGSAALLDCPVSK